MALVVVASSVFCSLTAHMFQRRISVLSQGQYSAVCNSRCVSVCSIVSKVQNNNSAKNRHFVQSESVKETHLRQHCAACRKSQQKVLRCFEICLTSVIGRIHLHWLQITYYIILFALLANFIPKPIFFSCHMYSSKKIYLVITLIIRLHLPSGGKKGLTHNYSVN